VRRLVLRRAVVFLAESISPSAVRAARLRPGKAHERASSYRVVCGRIAAKTRSGSGDAGESSVQILWEDGNSVVCRAWRLDADVANHPKV
jgi:hypothetical protein